MKSFYSEVQLSPSPMQHQNYTNRFNHLYIFVCKKWKRVHISIYSFIHALISPNLICSLCHLQSFLWFHDLGSISMSRRLQSHVVALVRILKNRFSFEGLSLQTLTHHKHSSDLARPNVGHTCHVWHRHDTGSYNYNESCDFLKLVTVSTYHCPCRVLCMCPYSCLLWKTNIALAPLDCRDEGGTMKWFGK